MAPDIMEKPGKKKSRRASWGGGMTRDSEPGSPEPGVEPQEPASMVIVHNTKVVERWVGSGFWGKGREEGEVESGCD
jgi:hypothetical protein